MGAQAKRVGRDLTEGPILPALLAFSVPIVLSSMIQQLYSMVDLMVIGKYVGNIGTVGVSTGGELSDLMTPIASGLAGAGQIYIAQLAGAKDGDRIKRATGTLLTFFMALSIIFTVGTFLFYVPVLHWLNCPNEAFQAASNYMLITAVGMPFIFGYNAVCAVLRGMGESQKPLIFIIVAAAVNIVLDLFLVAVIPLEETGTAIATVGSQIGAFLAAFFFMYRRREEMGFRLQWSYFRVNRRDLMVILKLGIPQLIRTLSVQGSMLWVKSSINAYGMVASATYSVGNKIEKFMNMFINGIDVAGGAMVGQNLGARKTDRVRKIIFELLVVSLSMACIVAALFVAIPDVFYSVFTNEAEVIEAGRTYLKIMAVGCFVIGAAGAMKSLVTGAGAALLSLTIGVLDGVTRVLVCLLMFHVLHQGAQSYFWGAAFCQAVPGLISGVYFLSGKWTKRKLLLEE